MHAESPLGGFAPGALLRSHGEDDKLRRVSYAHGNVSVGIAHPTQVEPELCPTA
jgi:hypothetical protein